MKYEVLIERKIERSLQKLPSDVQKLLFLLVADLQFNGPVQKSWPNFSLLREERRHCHVNYRYVACWTCRKNAIAIEAYSVGPREKALY